ncbi:MAG: hypothetical protein NC299_01015, partial [Lachnospiraceae bacterium]|nr:hypothetical protein [Ruminococcus sp.]MCM1273928.1 hypothetical protein [Lachnospiraceae bacterium]
LPIFFPSPTPPFPHFSVAEDKNAPFRERNTINAASRTAQNADLNALSTLACACPNKFWFYHSKFETAKNCTNFLRQNNFQILT